MKKSVLGLLLLLPFLIAFLAFTASDYVIKSVEQDISDIVFNYQALTPFSLKGGKQKLQAQPIYNEKYPLSEGNELVWSVPAEQAIARIDSDADGYYFVPLSEGQVQVTVSNVKGNVSRRFTALVYGESGALVVTLDYPFSTAGMNSFYWGDSDIEYATFGGSYTKSTAKIGFSYQVVGNDAMSLADFKIEKSGNLSVDTSRSEVSVLSPGDSYVRFIHPFSTSMPPVEIAFTAVEAVNVYSYSDLLMATNLSPEGEAVVLHVDLDSKENVDRAGGETATRKIFGEVDGKVDPERYVHTYETTLNHDFADGWNALNIYPIATTLSAGIYLRHSLYGNGFIINGHDLCYPEESTPLEGGAYQPVFGANDIFRGPNVYASAGNPYTPHGLNMQSVYPLFVIYGQDNSLIYVEGDDVTVDNLRLRNCDFGNNYSNLETAGTGIDILGDDVTISNSVVSSARTLIRSYSSTTNVNNCLLQNCLEFGIRAGANEYNRVDYSKQITYKDKNGNEHTLSNREYLSPLGEAGLRSDALYNCRADSVLSHGILLANQANTFAQQLNYDLPRDYLSVDRLSEGAKTVKKALTNENGFVNDDGSKNYYSEMTVSDCFFYNCHIAPIMVDSYANGSFFENSTSSIFGIILGQYMSYKPQGLALTMAPTLLTVKGDNRFYNYQEYSSLSFDSLIFQGINPFIQTPGPGGVSSVKVDVNEDDYLPIRKLIGTKSSALYSNGGKTYVNSPIMKMGGGSNLSDVVIEHSDTFSMYSVNCYDYSLTHTAYMVPDNQFMGSDEAKYSTMKVALSRAASNVMGFEDYTFYTLDMGEHPYFGETPSLSELSARS